jgi:hypothetical protein
MNRKLRKALLATLGVTALAGISTHASAQTVVDLGVLTAAGLSSSGLVAKYAWDGTNGLGGPPNNNGWNHTTKWFMFTVDSTDTVNIKVTNTNGTTGFNPAFSLFQTAGAYNGANHSSHVWNQTGITGESAFMATGSGNDKVTSWLGYANSGTTGWTNGGGTGIGTGSAGSSVVAGTSADLTLSLAAGQYLIGLGGSCYTDGSATACGTGQASFSLAVNAVPIPAAVWLFGSALAGMGVIGRRRKSLAVA